MASKGAKLRRERGPRVSASKVLIRTREVKPQRKEQEEMSRARRRQS